VAAAHAAGIVHRDLKPHNLFVSRRDDGSDLLKVLDFGVAKLQALEDAGSATRTGTLLGTAAYMAPEQARGESVIDHRADVYALGAVLYELVSLKRPHPGDSQNAILHHIATQPAVPLGAVQPDLPPAFVELVERALASDPAGRPGSAEVMARELGPFARRQVWPAGPQEAGIAPGEPRSPPTAGPDGRSAADGPRHTVASGERAGDRAAPTAAPRASRTRAKWLIGGSLLVLALGLVLARVRTSEPPRAAVPDGARAQAAASAGPRRMPEGSAGGPRASELGPRGESSSDSDLSPKAEVRGPTPEAPSRPAPALAGPAAVIQTANVERAGSGGRPVARKGTSAGRPAGRASQPPAPASPKMTPASSSPASRPGPGDRNLLGPAFDSVNPYE
jgi:serine/threonine-protein kinase